MTGLDEISKNDILKLVDMSWKFGVTASSSDAQVVGKTFLQLKLVLADSNSENGVRTVYLEMSLKEFYHFLAEMEKLKVQLDSY